MKPIIINANQGTHIISRHIYGHFAEHLGRCIYEGFWGGEDSDIPHLRHYADAKIPALSASASRKDGQINITICHSDPTHSAQVSVELRGAQAATARAACWRAAHSTRTTPLTIPMPSSRAHWARNN